MKIQFKKEYIKELAVFNSATEKIDEGSIYQEYHPKFSITYGEIQTQFDVIGIQIENSKIDFICYGIQTNYFSFFSQDYFEIVDYGIPGNWGIGGFPAGYTYPLFDCEEGIETDKYETLTKSIYYWGFPIFYSNVLLFTKFYGTEEVEIAKCIDANILKMNDKLKYISEDEYRSIINTICELP